MRHSPQAVGQTISAANLNALRSDARGGSILQAIQFLGSISLSTNPTDGQTLTLDINGTNVVVRFKNTISAANDVQIGASAAATVANLLAFLRNSNLTTTTQEAASAAAQLLLSYLWYQTTNGGTTVFVGSNNRTNVAPLTSFSASTTVTSGTYTANTMALFVNPGVCYVNGTEVYFAGGITPTVTAPSSHPRIDVLTLDNTGTLAWTTGTEASSPSAPTYPANKIPICELYNVTGETALYDNENQASGAGYIYNDVRPFLGGSINLAAVPDSIVPATDNTYNLGSSSFTWANIYAKNNVYVNGLGVAITKFGGTGSDGALSISSGTTTINCSSAAYVEKNYTSISITGTTGALAFSSVNTTNGTIIALRSQGNVTLTSTATRIIDLRSMGGGIGNALPAVGGGGAEGAGAGGGGGGSCAAGGNQGGGQSGAGASNAVQTVGGYGGPCLPYPSVLTRLVLPGGNGSGASGGGSGASGGSGGLGGGALYIECAGAYNFTGTIDASGATGGNGSNGSYSNGGGGGGGGAGGNVLVLYFSLTADSGTYTLTGASGGSGGTGGGSGGTGANGVAVRAANNYFA